MGRPAAPPAPWLPEAQELSEHLTLPRVARELRDRGEMGELTALQALHRVRWELGRAKLCPCGGPKSHAAVMCRPCRLARGWRKGRQGPEPRLIEEHTVLLAKRMYDAGLGMRTIAELLLPRTRYANLKSATESLHGQFATRGWKLRAQSEAMVLSNKRRAGLLPSATSVFEACDSTSGLTVPLAVGATWLLPPPRDRHSFDEFAYGHGQSVLEYWDANNECSHGWLPHEGCQECAGANVIELPHRDELAVAA